MRQFSADLYACLAILSLFAVGCSSSASPERGSPLEFRRLEGLSTNGPSAFAVPSEWLITDSSSWQRAWQESTAEEVPPLSVDLSENVLALVALGARPSGGYSIEITEVRHHESVLDVFVLAVSPTQDCVVPGGETAPMVAVVIPGVARSARFNYSTVEGC